MGKGKLQKFAEMESFSNVFQPALDHMIKSEFPLLGKWNTSYFKNQNPIVLELGCGRGEYTVGLASVFQEKNFIGTDIKGARIWKGAREALDKNLANVAFLRTRIEFITSAFGPGEVNEIWLTFPDPQEKKRRMKKRLTSASFLNMYKRFLAPEGIVHLKTDNRILYDYTMEVIRFNKLPVIRHTDDLYNSDMISETFGIKTYYENLFLNEGKSIHYIRFRLDSNKQLAEPPHEEREE